MLQPANPKVVRGAWMYRSAVASIHALAIPHFDYLQLGQRRAGARLRLPIATASRLFRQSSWPICSALRKNPGLCPYQRMQREIGRNDEHHTAWVGVAK